MSSKTNPDAGQPSKPAANKSESLTLLPRFRLRLGECFIARGVSPDRYFAATQNNAEQAATSVVTGPQDHKCK
jgi:hypothetical protein